MIDRDALLAAIIADPGDDTLRLAYADWLDENDLGVRDLGLRSWFIRWQINGETRGDTHYGIPYTLAWFVDKRHLWGSDRLSSWVYTAADAGLGRPNFGRYSWCQENDRSVWTESGPVRLNYTRGFVSDLQCPGNTWIAHHAGLLTQTPLRGVKLTSTPDYKFAPDSRSASLSAGSLPWIHIPGGDDFDHSRSGVALYLLERCWPKIKFIINRNYEAEVVYGGRFA